MYSMIVEQAVDIHEANKTKDNRNKNQNAIPLEVGIWYKYYGNSMHGSLEPCDVLPRCSAVLAVSR